MMFVTVWYGPGDAAGEHMSRDLGEARVVAIAKARGGASEIQIVKFQGQEMTLAVNWVAADDPMSKLGVQA